MSSVSRISSPMYNRKKRWAVCDELDKYRDDSEDEHENEFGSNIDAMARLAEVFEKGNETINTVRVMVIGCYGRVMVIGCYGQGKTSLVRNLLGKDLCEPKSTNGIEIHCCMGDTTGQQWVDKPNIAPEDEFVHRLVPVARELPENNTNMSTDTDSCRSFDPSNNHQISTVSDMNYVSDFKMRSRQLLDAPQGRQTMSTGSQLGLNAGIHPETEQLLRNKTKSETFVSLNRNIYRKFEGALKDDVNSKNHLAGIKVWDFGGEFVFYSTHQLFLCRQAVYLLVFRLDVSLDALIPDDEYPGSAKPHQRTMREYIEFWMSSVHAFVGDDNGSTPTIILVGTHKDKLNNTENATEYFESIRKIFDERILRNHIYRKCFDVSAIDDSDQNIKKLRKAIMKIYEKQIKLCKVPVKWIPLENALGQYKGNDVLSFEDVLELDGRNDYQIGRQQVNNFLEHHHDMGTLFYIPEGTPGPYVILNPQFITDAFKCVITSKKFFLSDTKLRVLWIKLSDKAVLDPKLLDIVRNEPRFRMHKHLLQECLIKLRVMGEALNFNANGNFTPLDYFIVPSFLRSRTKDEVQSFLKNKPRTLVSLLYEFKDEALLPSIFNRITAAAIGTWPILTYKGKDMLFTNCSAYVLDAVHSGLIKLERNNLEILVVQLCTNKKVAEKLSDYFRRFVEYAINDIINSPRRRAHCPVSKRFKCMDDMHDENGTIKSYAIEILDQMDQMDTIACPDYESHPGISISNVRQTWFGKRNERGHSNIPVRRLTDKEMAKLSEAIGDNWQTLGYYLDLNNVTIQHISRDEATEQQRIFNMLQRWCREKGGRATLDVLVKALSDNSSIKCDWDIIRNIIDGFGMR